MIDDAIWAKYNRGVKIKGLAPNTVLETEISFETRSASVGLMSQHINRGADEAVGWISINKEKSVFYLTLNNLDTLIHDLMEFRVLMEDIKNEE